MFNVQKLSQLIVKKKKKKPRENATYHVNAVELSQFTKFHPKKPGNSQANLRSINYLCGEAGNPS